MRTRSTPLPDALSDAVKSNIENVAKFYEREEEKISGTQSTIELISCFFGSPIYFGGFIIFVGLWIFGNLIAENTEHTAFDAAPFFWLQGTVGLNGMLITIAVLIRQNRMAKIAELRAHLSLQVHLLTEQKVTKVIQLLEALREDMPDVKDRYDPDVAAMQVDTNPHAVLNAIEAHNSGS